jgi:hypothetical protein
MLPREDEKVLRNLLAEVKEFIDSYNSLVDTTPWLSQADVVNPGCHRLRIDPNEIAQNIEKSSQSTIDWMLAQAKKEAAAR